MTMADKIRIHNAIEAEDREHRLWHHNNLMLDRLTDTYPTGTLVVNFGVIAEVVGYAARERSYTGDLILQEPETGMRWVGKTTFCTAIA